MAASMDDLIATINGGMHVGQQASDLKELHAALAQTLQNARPSQRPIPPTTKLGPHSDGPVPPPAPVSSWNDAVSPQPVHLLSGNAGWSGGMGNSPRQVGAPAVAPTTGVQFTGKRTTGFTPPPAEGNGARPHHDDVLPSNASPVDTGGFAQDAFRPLWDKQPKSPYQGFAR